MQIDVHWPPPPLWPNRKAHWNKKWMAAMAYKAYAAAMATGMRGDKAALYRLEIAIHPPDRRRRDMDNIESALKSAIDGFCGKVGIDDSRIVETIKRLSGIVPEGKITLTLSAIKGANSE
jgi:Holliday junction resolvase RusA-like endonuclease